MSNSAKQRSFIKDLIKHLEEIGLEVILEQSKNFILSIIYRDRKAKVSISCTPTNRASAQRATLSDVKRKITELDESIARAFNPQGLLQMMTNNGSSHKQNMGGEPIPEYESLRDSLRTILEHKSYPPPARNIPGSSTQSIWRWSDAHNERNAHRRFQFWFNDLSLFTVPLFSWKSGSKRQYLRKDIN